jgi:hypothetical protein
MRASVTFISPLLLLMALTAFPATASDTSGSWVQEAMLTASDAVPSSLVGAKTAIDGNTVVVANGGTEVDVYTKPASGWHSMTQVAILTPSSSEGDGFGSSVAISGNTIVVGDARATVNSNSNQGAVYVYVEPAGGWTNMTETAVLTASDGGAGDLLGQSVGISGNTIVAGAVFHNQNLGAAYVFVEPSGGWSSGTQTAELTASSSENSSELGSPIAISGDTVVASTILGGATLNDGSALVFVKPSTGWADMTQTAVLSSREVGLSGFLSLAMSGNTVAAGSPDITVNGVLHAGGVFVFVEPAGGWSNTVAPTAELTAGNYSKNANLGASVASDGTRIIAGAPYAPVGSKPEQGAAYVFDEPSGGWASMTESAEIVSGYGQPTALFGFSVGISGGTAVTGAPFINQEIGAAYIFGY